MLTISQFLLISPPLISTTFTLKSSQIFIHALFPILKWYNLFLFISNPLYSRISRSFIYMISYISYMHYHILHALHLILKSLHSLHLTLKTLHASHVIRIKPTWLFHYTFTNSSYFKYTFPSIEYSCHILYTKLEYLHQPFSTHPNILYKDYLEIFYFFKPLYTL